MKLHFGSRTELDRLRRELDECRSEITGTRAREARLAAAVEMAPVGLVVVDETGREMLRSRAARLGSHAEVLLDEALEELLRDALGGVIGQRRLELFGPPQRVLLLSAVPLGDRGAMALIDDVSERARLDAVRTDFIANISHELKTPVGALAVLAETLVDNDDLTVAHRLAGKMMSEAYRVSATIDDLLELSRIELGGRGESEVVSLSAVFGEVAARHRLTAETAGVALRIGPGNGLAVVGDRLQLVSAVSNLVDNAVKYTDRGGTVAVKAQAAGGAIEIEVCDTGVGIPAGDIDRVFERFYRVDRARSRATGGTGLGLAIVRHVANNHGGEVSVHSREGEGSTFTLRIPIDDVTKGTAR